MVTSHAYDTQGNRTYTYLPDATITNWYDSLKRLVMTGDAWGYEWYTYNNQGLVASVSNSFGAKQITIFDVEDRSLYVLDANGMGVTNSYDALGRLRTRTYPDGGVEKFGYSARGLTAYTNQLDKVTYYVYDEGRRKTFETNANSEVIRYTNNAAGDLLSLVDGKNQVTKWKHDEYGRVTNKLDQAGTEILRYKYDPNSRLTNRWSAEKGDTKYKYDPVGNLTNIDYALSTDVSLQYDPLNRVTNMVDAVGTTIYGYAAGGQLYTENGPWSDDTVTNIYNNRLRTALRLAQPTSIWTNTFSYDAAKRLTSVISPAGSFSYGHAPASSYLLTSISLPNGTYITNTYDANARLLSTTLKNSSHSPLNSHTYVYNSGNQRTQQAFGTGSTYDYTYDPIGQLKIADSATASEDRGYTYDTAWNLNYRTNNTTLKTFSVDGLNQLTSITSEGSCSYDANGNLTSSHSAKRTYVHDDENQLVQLYVSTSASVPEKATEFVYDGQGRLRIRREYIYEANDDSLTTPPPGGQARLQKKVFEPLGSSWTLVSETRYIYDGWRVIQERAYDAGGGGYLPTVSYTRGMDLSGSLEGAGGIGGLLARSNDYSSGNWSTHNYYHADGNGNITYLVNSSQTVAASYRYDPYGNLISSGGSLASANEYRFSSKMVHTGSGLYYYGYRFYEPNFQRWLNLDPADDRGSTVNHVQNVRESEIDRNLLRFVANNPSTFVDSFGLTWRAGGTWDGKDDSIVCDSQGGIRPALTKNTQCGCDPARKCRIEHEVSHAKDVLVENPDICQGKADGTQIYTRNTRQNNASERRAYDKEIDCVQKNAAAFNKECSMSATDFIDKLKKDRKRYE